MQVWRCLNHHVRSKDQSSRSDGPQMLVQRGFGMVGHLRAGLGTEVLDDHFLDMAMARMAVADRLQRLDPLGACFADSDQQAGRERHPRPRYEVIANGAMKPPRRRIAHANVERVDLKPDPRIPELSNLLGKGFILPAPIL